MWNNTFKSYLLNLSLTGTRQEKWSLITLSWCLTVTSFSVTWSLGNSSWWGVLRSVETPDVLALARWSTHRNHCSKAGEGCYGHTALLTKMSPVTELGQFAPETWLGSVNQMECARVSKVHSAGYWLKEKKKKRGDTLKNLLFHILYAKIIFWKLV